MDRRFVEEVKHVSIDEKNFRKGQSYVSLLYDLNASRVLEVVADKNDRIGNHIVVHASRAKTQ